MLRLKPGSIASLALLLLTLGMRLASVPTANLSYLLLAAYALMGRAQAIQALALSWLFTMLSPGIGPEATLASIGRYAVLAGATMSVLLRSGVLHGRGTQINRLVAATLLLGVLICAHALLFSPMADVSLLKAVSWTLACATLISAWSGLSPESRELVERQIFGGLVILMLVSLPLLGTSLGFLRNGTGFQGVLNHPQAFGPTMAVLATWAASRALNSNPPPYRLMGIFVLCLALIVLSEARTAGLGLLIALILAAFVLQALTRRRLKDLFPAIKSRRFVLAAMLALTIVSVSTPVLSGFIQSYISKRGEVAGLVEVYDRSRGRLMQEMWANVREHPWTGIGFGIASDPLSMEVERDPVLGLPVGASIEKGVLPLAVLEELGIPGAVAVLAWLWLLVRRSIRGRRMAPIALLFTALLLNMGEMMLFSPGGMGLLMLVVIGYAASEKVDKPGPRRVIHG